MEQEQQDQGDDIDGIKRTRRGGKKRRGGVAHRRRQQAYLAAQARKLEQEGGYVGYTPNPWQGGSGNNGQYMARHDHQQGGNRMNNRFNASNNNINHSNNNKAFNIGGTANTTASTARRPRRAIQTDIQTNFDVDGYDVNQLPMTPSLAAMTPRSRSLTIGQILLARALVSEVIGGRDRTPLSHKEVEAAATPRGVLSSDEEYASSPSTVSKLPRSPPIVPTVSSPHIASSPRIPAPSPNSAKKLSKEEFQALVNARVKKSISERNAQARAIPVPRPEPPKKVIHNRFNTVYMTPGGQTIAFKDTGKNTPPTPKFGGESTKQAVDVEWSAYEAVHGPRQDSPEIRPQSWRVTPAHASTAHSQPLWSESLPHPTIATIPFYDINI